MVTQPTQNLPTSGMSNPHQRRRYVAPYVSPEVTPDPADSGTDETAQTALDLNPEEEVAAPEPEPTTKPRKRKIADNPQA